MDGPSASRRTRTLAWVSLALVVLASLPWTVHAWYDPTNDGSMYVATARSLVAGEGYALNGVPFLVRPPGFSALLALLLAWRGTDFHAINLAVSLSGALGVVLFHFLLRDRLGLLLAWLLPLVLWFNPGYQRLCNQVMSDVPGFAGLAGTLLLARWAGRRPGWRSALGLGVALGLGALLRSGNLLLVPALLVAALARELRGGTARLGWRATATQAAALVLGTVLVLAPWSARNRAVAPPPPADQTLLYSYSAGMWHRDMGDPRSPRVPLAEVLARFPEQTRKSAHTLGTRLVEDGARPWTPLVAGLLVLALAVNAVRRRAPEELFALGTLAVVAFYFGYAGRLLLPVYAFALMALVELVRAGVARIAGGRAGLAAGVLLAVGVLAADWKPRLGWDGIRELHQAYLETARSVRTSLPEGARLGAWRGWHHAVYLERPVISFEHACERAQDVKACEAIIDAYGVDTVLLTPLGLPAPVARAERELASYVARRYGGRELGLVRVR